MKEIEIIRYLLDEIEEEIEYNKNYEEAEKIHGASNWYELKRQGFYHIPNRATIKQNKKKIRKLLLKNFGEN